MPVAKRTESPPKVSPRVLRAFRWYTRRNLRSAFHTVSLSETTPAAPTSDPLIVYLNHASWWDPLVAMQLARLVAPERTLYAPFDAEALARYPIFERLGFFPVDQGSQTGAAQFLRTARAVLEEPDASLWLTPEGRFVDQRDHTAVFEPGLAHLIESLSSAGRRATLWPLAIEYAFWEERLPEALCSFGEPISLSDYPGLDKPAWRELLQERLRSAQRELAEKSHRRDPAEWRMLIGGSEGVGGPYEAIRWLKAKLTGQTYRAAHSDRSIKSTLS